MNILIQILKACDTRFLRLVLVTHVFSIGFFSLSVPRAECDIVAIVGNQIISGEDMHFKKSILRCYPGPSQHDHVILLQLIEANMEEEIATKIGVTITDQMLNIESERVERETKAPQILSNIKAIFSGNREDYKRIFLKPILVNRLLISKFRMMQLEGSSKTEFHKWFIAQCKMIKIVIKDNTLRSKLKDELPSHRITQIIE